MSQEVRVRIAPSPTGDPHVGTAYIALFNWIFAKQHHGKFILRIEDTDQTRSRSSSEQMILDSLSWLGLNWDEGPDCGGPYAPYRQSERKNMYAEYAHKLIQSKNAYYCFCTAERLDEVRKQKKSQHENTKYDRHCLTLSSEEIMQKLNAKTPHVIRLKIPDHGETTFQDFLRGEIKFNTEQIDDQVLLKSDGMPTYHLANVVDDYLMKISHVIRAEEWIASTPKHVLLYQAFGWKEPTWVHMPLLRNQDKSKISKRKNPTSIMFYKRAGILPHALLNFLALMGWSYSGDQEIFSLNEMLEKFQLKDVNLGGPVFDMTKLNWLNSHYLKNLSDNDFVDYCQKEIFSANYLKKLKQLLIPRIQKFDEVLDKGLFFFNGALDYNLDQLVPQGKTKEDYSQVFITLAELLDELYEWENKKIHDLLESHRTSLNLKGKEYFMPIRMAVTGRTDSPPLTETMEVLGREIVRYRLRDAGKKLSS